MMFLRMRQFIPIIVLAIFLSSCNDYQKALKNEDVKVKYDMAEKLYGEGDFRRANRLFEQIAPKYIGKPQGERVMFFFANTFFETGSYSTAAYQFERFVKSYSTSDKIPEASFLSAKSYYKLSPDYSLDQTNTDKALGKLQIFINTYPESEFFKEANEMAQELSRKKERKAFEIVKQFTKLGEFYSLEYSKSAIASSNNFISDFPGSIYFEEMYYLKFLASTNLAMNSYDRIKKDRLLTAREEYKVLKKKYPETTFAKKADNLLKKIEKEIINCEYIIETK